jgi:7,8-dihydroneopterin aldolase/epimerase/oxygenase
MCPWLLNMPVRQMQYAEKTGRNMDKIIVKNLKLFAYHGVNPEEKEDGQNFIMDIIADVDLSVPCLTDNVEDTVSYAKIIKEARRVFLLQKDDLIERVARRVAEALLISFEKIQRVTILLKKPEAPIKADFEYVAVEISLGRDEL